MIPNFLNLINLGDKMSKLSLLADKKLPGDMSAISVLGATTGAKVHIMSSLPLKKLIIVPDHLAGQSLTEKLGGYLGSRVAYLPSRDDVLLSKKQRVQADKRRILALSAVRQNMVDVLIASVDALLQTVPSPDILDRFSVTIDCDQEHEPLEIVKDLTTAGYARQDMIGEMGDIALRGDILDVWFDHDKAVRIEFFDDLVENIYIIDPNTQSKIEKIDNITLTPMSEFLLGENDIDSARQQLIGKSCQTALDTNSMLHVGALNPLASWGLPFFGDSVGFVTDYFVDNAVVLFDEPKLVHDKIEILTKEFGNRHKKLLEENEVTEQHKNLLLNTNEVKRRTLLMRKVAFSELNLSNPMFETRMQIRPKSKPVIKYYLDHEQLKSDIKTFMINGFKIVFCAGDETKSRAIISSLNGLDIPAVFGQTGDEVAPVLVTPLGIKNGFVYPDLKIIVIGTLECVGKVAKKQFSPNQHFTPPKQGDYVVHSVHGIGCCEGTTMMKNGDFEKEFVVLRYAGGDKVFVACDQMDNLTKFIGEEHPRLNKIGGKEFQKEKEKVKASLRKLAINLLEVYKKRELEKGVIYSADTDAIKEFEDSFEYTETADQLNAIADIKSDMQSGKIMDRLIVGDVGFGKTEVAFRAMFKTVQEAKQAVLLAPTTILARQHFENLAPRLEKFGIKCALLTRLQSASENKQTMQDLQSGDVQIVVATHKVLSREISFFDLGLLVVDEEQRFGVEHKEKLKEKFPTLNILTLSATPIPRTLNMSLSGIRDISLLETAPEGRLEVQTYLVPYSDTVVLDAISTEYRRGGQTLILLNNIDQLDIFKNHIASRLDGDIKILSAHGQLSPLELESRIAKFYKKEYDVLIATTIIENGLDLPDANTLIVLDSDRFGLSQLHQLRGRVGRRGALAHAYFTVPENKIISENADKRLRALEANSEIGSGFRIALSDLSIRGAGSLLGAEQHGHIERVGYEMYIKMLNQAVYEARNGVEYEEHKDVEMKIDAPAFIPDGYMSEREKLRTYTDISRLATKRDRDNLLQRVEDAYGQYSVSLSNLANIALLKNLAKQYDVKRVMINKNGAGVFFYDQSMFKRENLMCAVSDNADKVMIASTIPPSLLFDVKPYSVERKLEILVDFFANI